MKLERFVAVDAFLARAGGFLGEREAAHNLIFGICASLAADPSAYDGPAYLAAVSDDAGRIVGAAIRTPPWNLVLSEIDDAAALGPLVDDLSADPSGASLPGVLGPLGVAGTFVGRWSMRTGRSGRLVMSERIYSLSAVRPVRPVPGRMRIAGPADRDLLVGWLDAFYREALDAEAARADAPATVDRWLAGQRTSYLWDDDGAASWCVIGDRTPTGTRVGPVYTPPGRRRRGYASALVAAASQAALDRGSRSCFLFTDLANPTSNRIYLAIGYEPVRDVEMYAFD